MGGIRGHIIMIKSMDSRTEDHLSSYPALSLKGWQGSIGQGPFCLCVSVICKMGTKQSLLHKVLQGVKWVNMCKGLKIVPGW